MGSRMNQLNKVTQNKQRELNATLPTHPEIAEVIVLAFRKLTQ